MSGTSLSIDHFVDSSPQAPPSADFFSGKLESPVALRVAVGVSRDETAAERDRASHEQDELADKLDGDALLRDRRAEELDRSDELADRQTLRVEDVRARAAQARGRTVGAREDARTLGAGRSIAACRGRP